VTNGVKHAGAERVEVVVSVQDDLLTVDVRNDGREFRSSARRSGLGNLDKRAAKHGGTMTVATEAGRTRLVWTVPVAAVEPANPARPRARGTKVPAPRRERRAG
jgi:signal transduction histidine kinase